MLRLVCPSPCTEGLLSAFEESKIPPSPFDPKDSTLLVELLSLKQPLCLGHAYEAQCQFYLDLGKAIFKHGTANRIESRTMFIERNKTNDDRVVLFGKTRGGHLWKVEFRRRRLRDTGIHYRADVRVGSKKLRDRTVHASL
jgi:hypothetical protein